MSMETSMIKSLWILLFLLMAALPCLAQNPYQFDNFDTQNGVRVRVAPEVTRPRTIKGRLLVKLTPAQNGNKLRLTSLAYPQPGFIPASGSSKVLDGFTTGDAQVDG